MKTIIGLLAVLALTVMPAFAITGDAGVAGHVFYPDGRPVANANVAIFRLPLHEVDKAVATTTTDDKGYFLKMPLQPGHYMLDVAVPGNTSACSAHDLIDETVTHVTMRLAAHSGCAPVRLHSVMVNGALTSDLYIVH
ncbi:MAG TPA: carboxypeptidase-like regulatory domain-containing protein [Candidatus Acidoferrum sp.]|nr:carboxypeptidase-like regulatory domain-containing protein [Candidatus Acidoferrum sp.]